MKKQDENDFIELLKEANKNGYANLDYLSINDYNFDFKIHEALYSFGSIKAIHLYSDEMQQTALSLFRFSKKFSENKYNYKYFDGIPIITYNIVNSDLVNPYDIIIEKENSELFTVRIQNLSLPISVRIINA